MPGEILQNQKVGASRFLSHMQAWIAQNKGTCVQKDLSICKGLSINYKHKKETEKLREKAAKKHQIRIWTRLGPQC